MATERILWNRRPTGPSDCGDIDEIVLDNVNVHVEQMGDRCWWIGLYKGGTEDPYWMGNFVADSRGRMRFAEQENAGIEWDDDRSHEPEAPHGPDEPCTCGNGIGCVLVPLDRW